MVFVETDVWFTVADVRLTIGETLPVAGRAVLFKANVELSTAEGLFQ